MWFIFIVITAKPNSSNGKVYFYWTREQSPNQYIIFVSKVMHLLDKKNPINFELNFEKF